MPSPIQIVLNPESYEEARESGGGGGARDFFAHSDREFKTHKAAVIDQLQAVAAILRAQAQGNIGYVKVILRREAWAKSHRPLAALFRSGRTPLVGGGDLGVMIVEARPSTLLDVATEVAKAEEHTIMRFEEARGKDTPNPSVRKSETGAIDRVELYGPVDRRAFSADDAIAWLSNPMTGGSYQVELFDIPALRSEWDALDADRRRLYESFLGGFNALSHGLSVERLPSRKRGHALLSIRLDQSRDRPILRLTEPPQRDRRRELVPFSVDVDRHQHILDFLDKHPLVRRIELPGIVVRTQTATSRTRPEAAVVPVRDSRRSYPRLGIVDGGISDVLSDWVIERWDLLANEDVDLAHGTFIGGLVTLGSGLNGPDVCGEADGAELVDVAIFPNDRKAGAFTSYFDGLPQFFDEMETAIAEVLST